MSDDVEVVRKRYRPEHITTLFVGESAPCNGTFFYCGNTPMKREMQKAIERAFGKTDDFLTTFKAYGWYLDDLVLEPVNGLSPVQRRAKCWEAQKGLATRIAEYHPEAIVTLLRSIDHIVVGAAQSVGFNSFVHSVSFPGNGQQARFQSEMAAIIRRLPRSF